MCEIAGYTFLGVDTARDLFDYWFRLLGISTVMEWLSVVLVIMAMYAIAVVVKLAVKAWR